MKIAVIGAGSCGLAALRHCTSGTYDCEVVCYEKTDQVGGTWVYTEETGLDRYGLPIHTSMYKNLRTNLPKEVMGYPDYPIPDTPESYLTRTQILEFLNSYCDHFKLRQHIRFLHNVELVTPTSGGDRKWTIKVKDLQKNTVTSDSFDAVMVCNGHYFKPNVPNLKGHETFQGRQLHSHDYRTPDIFTNKTVVVVGAGPSGMDLALDISKKATRVILSHHTRESIGTIFPENVVQKPDIKELTQSGALFTDGSSESIDAVFYCTGYEYSFPFLDPKCGVRVDSNMVTPLWKHLISIENPTLAVVGIPYYVCAFNMFDLQVRFVLRFWSGKKDFPSKEDMLKEEKEELEKLLAKGLRKRHFHEMGHKQGVYFDDIANIAGITRLPPVISKLHDESSMRFLDDLVHYRESRYKIIDDYNFIQL
ncbi:dimethylaniline monooxygenase [N-oxide-forming] 3-like [Colletes gigas]|uniref:dimethylaniline monooxygenase [N-oxide-forming] 3-like n=1 Tax=Colletes gigas TaxID=935657 RepID=UPI001C9BA6CA|nr:dimethylaniline monooxygenase [N-oxide-forming] 3-like [Colletes gigas]XP_043256573.1 dimethylaniline monooxygenase [N-oxide-forming] 3-like [Colletes gigas]XP_043256574.1 dimethylaniline monooxygenase [N-oxide-forming] 3-like [Colletes gigas]